MVRKILLSLIALLGGGILLSLAQSKQISGTVTGPDGKPVAGATVMVDGSHVGTTSNGDGSFTITAPGNGSLVVSFIGYETQKVAIGGKTRINISLKEDAQAIDDVIVVAFGTAKKDAFTGAAKVIKSAVFERRGCPRRQNRRRAVLLRLGPSGFRSEDLRARLRFDECQKRPALGCRRRALRR